MNIIDWLLLSLTIASVVVYGMYRSKRPKDLNTYLLAERKLPWYHVGLSVMATQASAITFLSAPGQAYGDGIRFIQFYFGLPLATIVLCTTFIPAFRSLNVYTAYEFLERRFDRKTRTFTSLLFLLQRGLSTGITIYAPSIVVSTILGLDLRWTTVFTGGIVILYTVSGGSKAVSYTQLLQMIIIFTGLFVAGWMVVSLLPEGVGFIDALHIAGKSDRLNAIDTSFDLNNRYTIWSGIIGGFFLQLSYFGTDQSQVGRYLTGKNDRESKLGLLMNGFVKIPMQFFILLIGTLVFAYYQFHQPPAYFNRQLLEEARNSSVGPRIEQLETSYGRQHQEKRRCVESLTSALHANDEADILKLRNELTLLNHQSDSIRKELVTTIQKQLPEADANDTNYVFLTFVLDHLPHGLIGILIAIILLAAMGSTSSGLNSLGSSTVIDVFRANEKQQPENKHDWIRTTKWSTGLWGVFAIAVALFASRLGNLLEAVNILGSLFYGTILGIFLTAFLLKNVKGTPVFIAAILTEIMVIVAWMSDFSAFLWLNVLGTLSVMILSLIFDALNSIREKDHRTSDT
ncbi:MAG: sodium:solute symporter [Bacteroidota bacterium]